jgi:hypothetical protein
MPRFSLRAVAVVALVAVASLTASPSAYAQPWAGRGGGGGFGGMGEVLNPPVNSRDLDKYGKIVGVTPDQRAVLTELFNGFQEAFRDKAEAMQAEVDAIREKARETGDNSVWATIREPFTKFSTEREQMEKTFFEDVKSILTPEQLELWPRVETTRRRETTIGRGLMAGERVDLIRMVEEAKLPVDVAAQVAPVLAQYETELDRALIERNKMQDEARNTFMRGGFGAMFGGRGGGGGAAGGGGGGGQAMDPAAMEKMFNATRDASVRLRDVNRRFGKQIESLMPEDRRAAWDLEFKRESFPDVYREATVLRQMTAVTGFSDITPEQKTQIADLRAQFEREYSPMADKLAAAQEEQQMKMTMQGMMQMWGRGGNEEGPVADLRRQRREMERATGEKLKAILTPEQVERLPQPEQQAGREGAAPREGREGRRNREGGMRGENGDRPQRRPDRT